mgnify:CR=1 FL=1
MFDLSYSDKFETNLYSDQGIDNINYKPMSWTKQKNDSFINGEVVYLDAPFIYETETEEDILEEAKHRGKNVKLGKPFRTPGGPKKFAVYVRKPGGGIKKVTFGDPHLRIKNSNKKRAKSFRARHKCSEKKDRTTAGYWSCHVGRYAKQLGLSSSNSW